MNQELYQYYIIDRIHRDLRVACEEDMGAQYQAQGLEPVERMTRRFEKLSAMETPRIHPLEKIVLTRTVKNLPDVLTEAEWAEIRKAHYVHELGYVSNLSPDYETAIATGLLKVRETANEYQARMIDAVIALCDRYKTEAEKLGRSDVVEVLTQVPRYPARNFREALQFFRILHFTLWLEGDYHNTVGRFDQYMYPYFQKDLTVSLPKPSDEDGAVITEYDLSIETVSADVEILGIQTQKCELENVSGEISASLLGEMTSLQIENISGNVSIHVDRLDRFDVESVSGNVSLTGEDIRSGDIETVSGNVSLHIPPNHGYAVDFDSVSGDIHFHGAEVSKVGDRYTVGDGSRRYDVETVSGDVKISEYKA